MKKGMFYLLPLLALTQIGASNGTLQVEKGSHVVKSPRIGETRVNRGTDLPKVMKTLPRTIEGRNRIARRTIAAGLPTRAGRNVRRSIAPSRVLLKRQ